MDDERYYTRTIVKKQLHSAYLQTERSLRIYLPPGYDERISYPVLFCQDGEQFFNFGRIATHATKLILDEGIEPMLIVGVDVDLPRRTAEYAPEGARFQLYQRFFVEEMLPEMERSFSVRTSPDSRVLAGDSLGGTVSLHLALDYPELFQQVLSLSGAFLPSTLQKIEEQRDLSWLNLFMVIG